MVSRNSILLIVKQNPGIGYDALVNKIASDYGNVNSARAALSRAVKDFTAFGLVKRDNNNLFLTPEGEKNIFTELKNKLLLNLNALVNSRQAVNNADEIVKQLAVLIERSKKDRHLLEAAKSSADFFVSDIDEISEQVIQKLKQWAYLKKIMKKQARALRELNFNDALELGFSRQALNAFEAINSLNNLKEFSVESKDSLFLSQLASGLGQKPKEGMLLLPSGTLKQALKAINIYFKKDFGEEVTLYLADLKIKFLSQKIRVLGPCNALMQLSELIKKQGA
jgi:hypothetical protein